MRQKHELQIMKVVEYRHAQRSRPLVEDVRVPARLLHRRHRLYRRRWRPPRCRWRPPRRRSALLDRALRRDRRARSESANKRPPRRTLERRFRCPRRAAESAD